MEESSNVVSLLVVLLPSRRRVHKVARLPEAEVDVIAAAAPNPPLVRVDVLLRVIARTLDRRHDMLND